MPSTLLQRFKDYAKTKKLSDFGDTVDVGGWTLAFIFLSPFLVLFGLAYLLGVVVKLSGVWELLERVCDKLFAATPDREVGTGPR
jgi:hypothetical protein